MVKLDIVRSIILGTILLLISTPCMANTSEYRTMNYSEFRSNQKSFESNDGEIKYIDEGKGEVIFLLHGIPTSSWLYRKMIDKLVTSGKRVIAPDMLGFGNSASPEGYEIYSESNHAKRILQLMNHLQIDTWEHVMHDGGGLWTWELFKIAPKKITKLTILNSVILQEGFKPPVKMKPGLLAKISMRMYRRGITRNILLNQLFKAGIYDTTLSKEDKKGYQEPLKEGKTKGMYYFFTQTCKSLPNYLSYLEKIEIPIQVIWGRYDEMLLWIPQSEKLKQSLKIDDKNIHIIEASHFIQEEKPDEIIDFILNF